MESPPKRSVPGSSGDVAVRLLEEGVDWEVWRAAHICAHASGGDYNPRLIYDQLKGRQNNDHWPRGVPGHANRVSQHWRVKWAIPLPFKARADRVFKYTSASAGNVAIDTSCEGDRATLLCGDIRPCLARTVMPTTRPPAKAPPHMICVGQSRAHAVFLVIDPATPHVHVQAIKGGQAHSSFTWELPRIPGVYEIMKHANCMLYSLAPGSLAAINFETPGTRWNIHARGHVKRILPVGRDLALAVSIDGTMWHALCVHTGSGRAMWSKNTNIVAGACFGPTSFVYSTPGKLGVLDIVTGDDIHAPVAIPPAAAVAPVPPPSSDEPFGYDPPGAFAFPPPYPGVRGTQSLVAETIPARTMTRVEACKCFAICHARDLIVAYDVAAGRVAWVRHHPSIIKVYTYTPSDIGHAIIVSGDPSYGFISYTVIQESVQSSYKRTFDVSVSHPSIRPAVVLELCVPRLFTYDPPRERDGATARVFALNGAGGHQQMWTFPRPIESMHGMASVIQLRGGNTYFAGATARKISEPPYPLPLWPTARAAVVHQDVEKNVIALIRDEKYQTQVLCRFQYDVSQTSTAVRSAFTQENEPCGATQYQSGGILHTVFGTRIPVKSLMCVLYPVKANDARPPQIPPFVTHEQAPWWVEPRCSSDSQSGSA